MTLDEIYNIKRLDEKTVDKETNVYKNAGLETTSDLIFFLSEIEVNGTTNRSVIAEGSQYYYYSLAPENKYKEPNAFDIFSSIGFGTLLLVFIPILFILLLSFVFGVSLAILLLVIYILGVWLSSIFAGYLIGLIVYKKFIKKDLNILLVGLVGISVYSLLQIVPFIGFYVTLVGMLLGLGVIFKLFKKD